MQNIRFVMYAQKGVPVSDTPNCLIFLFRYAVILRAAGGNQDTHPDFILIQRALFTFSFCTALLDSLDSPNHFIRRYAILFIHSYHTFCT